MKKIYSLLSLFLLSSPMLMAANRTAKENYALQAAEIGSVSADTVFWALAMLGLILIFAIIWVAGSFKEMLSSDALIKKINNNKGAGILLALVALPLMSAADPEGTTQSIASWNGVYILAVFDGVLLAIFFYLISIMKDSLNTVLPKKEVKKEVKDVKLIRFGIKEKWSAKWIMYKLTKRAPIEHEDDVLTDHDYDGIQELDNQLPPWWLYGFYFSIGFAIVYLLYYTAFKVGNTTVQDLEEENRIALIEAAEREALNPGGVNEENVVYDPTDDRIARGMEIFMGKGQCTTCHKADGSGSVGVNLTDKHWIYGGNIRDIFYTLKYGRNGKGNMPAQGDKLSPDEIQDLATFVLTLKYVSPEQGGKPAEGEVWEGEQPKPEGAAPEVNQEADAASDSTAITVTEMADETADVNEE